ncbi:hypothetical protein A6R68_17424 [Neotoma lepida]|uniref:Myosin motor domain-containing protein n=1 Tax=Neotoma lepida TaxID=56216 RepID=A0A1A6HC25_NEOLE|nr:hypothetical protein A6R68_17424 [Neotoma lepida]
MELYSRCHLGELPPHIFAIANECYRCLWKRHDNQCVLIRGGIGIKRTRSFKAKVLDTGISLVSSGLLCPLVDELVLCSVLHDFSANLTLSTGLCLGQAPSSSRVQHKKQHMGGQKWTGLQEKDGESGAGKTESTKLILKFLSVISQHSLDLSLQEKTSCVEQAILQSRYRIGFLPSNPIMEAFGNAKTVYNNNSSRFGKFVQLNICQKGNIQGGRIVDCILFRFTFVLALGPISQWTLGSLVTAMEVMQFSKEEVREVLRLLAGILHLGNIEFITAGGAQVSFKTALGRSAELLGLDPTQLTDALTQRSMFLRGEEILTPLSVQQKLGLLALINEESHFPQATDSTLLEKLHNQHSVLYDVRGILEKNRDTFRDDLLNLLRESRFDFIYDLFEHVSSRNNQDTLKCGSKHRRPTVSSQFKDSLHSLMATLSSSNPFFVRCIKPNTQKIKAEIATLGPADSQQQFVVDIISGSASVHGVKAFPFSCSTEKSNYSTIATCSVERTPPARLLTACFSFLLQHVALSAI